ncbi:MAG TPA: hemolysin III family protein [Methylococcus sp.]|nr:hemolysin III family protein [Methylococcus sp.]
MSIYAIPGFTHPVSSLMHLLGAGIFALLAIPLWRRCPSRSCRCTMAIFSLTVVFLLSMSGVYHLLGTDGTAHRVLQRLDHAAIFALIAGSFTPLQPGFFHNGWARWGVLLVVWSLAITGIVLKVIFFDAIPEWLGLTLYLGLGWIGLGSGVALARRHGFSFIRPLVYGGLAYTLGGIADFAQWPELIPGVVGPHELLHVGVLFGIGGFWWFFYQQVSALPCPPPNPRRTAREPWSSVGQAQP